MDEPNASEKSSKKRWYIERVGYEVTFAPIADQFYKLIFKLTQALSGIWPNSCHSF